MTALIIYANYSSREAYNSTDNR